MCSFSALFAIVFKASFAITPVTLDMDLFRRMKFEVLIVHFGQSLIVTTQLKLTCSKLTIEIVEKGVKYLQS